MKKIEKTRRFALAAIAALVLAGCESTKVEPKSEKVDVEKSAVEVTVIDWADRTLGETAVPAWLKQINRGNADAFKEQYGVAGTRICKLAKANAKTEATAQALSRAGFAYSMAAELNQKVIGRVGQGLNDVGQLEAVYVAASETKAEMTGMREETTFWQKVRSKDNEKGTTVDSYIYYTVYSMSAETWDALLKKYLMDIMGGANLETETQKKIGALYSEMKADADKKDEAKALAEERAYNEQMERIKNERAKIDAETAAKNAGTEDGAAKQAVKDADNLASFLL